MRGLRVGGAETEATGPAAAAAAADEEPLGEPEPEAEGAGNEVAEPTAGSTVMIDVIGRQVRVCGAKEELEEFRTGGMI